MDELLGDVNIRLLCLSAWWRDCVVLKKETGPFSWWFTRRGKDVQSCLTADAHLQSVPAPPESIQLILALLQWTGYNGAVKSGVTWNAERRSPP